MGFKGAKDDEVAGEDQKPVGEGKGKRGLKTSESVIAVGFCGESSVRRIKSIQQCNECDVLMNDSCEEEITRGERKASVSDRGGNRMTRNRPNEGFQSGREKCGTKGEPEGVNLFWSTQSMCGRSREKRDRLWRTLYYTK